MSTSAATIIVNIRHPIADVILSNPDKLNAINALMWDRLADEMIRLDEDEGLRCIILRGEGQVFAAGGDIEEVWHERRDPLSAMAYHERVARALTAIENCRHPTIAAIHGPCAGGGLEIACACDFRIAGDGARFGAPIMKLGFSLYPGELKGLLKLLGPAVCKEILLEGRLLNAREALEKGLLTRVVADEMVLDEVEATARRICAGAPLAARWNKQWIHRLSNGQPASREELLGAFAFLDTEDYAEGMQAFFSKRPPVFKGR